MLANLSQEDHAQIESFYQAAYANSKAVALREEFRPLIREQMQQAHEKLGFVIASFEPNSGISEFASDWYEQHSAHMTKVLELMAQLLSRTTEILQEDAQ
jgi:L-amino acid N-acyltransferase YncA